MCGIAGYVGPDPQGDAASRVRALVAAQDHRGPDGSGLLVGAPGEPIRSEHDAAGPVPLDAPSPQRGAVVLGSCRLAIRDTSAAGRQPMVTPDGRYAVVFNGEIYNSPELGRELEGLGYRFRSRCDTEVLLAAIARWGDDCLGRLVGMFAFAALDRAGERVLLARDPFGIKPLHWAEVDRGVALSSEISPLLEWPGVSRRVSPRALRDYLEHGVLDGGEDTLFADVAALPPGHYAWLSLSEPGVPKPAPFWRPDLGARADLDPEVAGRRLRELFLESVALHLRSDVPVGVLLSGGLDSSSVAMAMRHVGGASLEIHSFSYVAGHGAPSEEPWIDAVNSACGAIPHKLRLEPAELQADLGPLVGAQDEPFGSLAIYAQSRLFRAAREAGVPVVLSGTGSDEMLMGYEWYWPAQLLELLRRGAPGGAARLLAGVAGARSGGRALRVAASAGLLALPSPMASAVQRLRRTAPWVDRGWARAVPSGLGADAGRRLAERIRHRLAVGLPDLLRYEDRGAMAHGVEARVPFLTRELAELALALAPPGLMGPRGETKWLLRRAMRGLVPDAVLARPEMAFSVPLATWPGLMPEFAPSLSSLAGAPALDGRVVASLVEAVRRPGRLAPAEAYPAWRLFGLASWASHFGVELG